MTATSEVFSYEMAAYPECHFGSGDIESGFFGEHNRMRKINCESQKEKQMAWKPDVKPEVKKKVTWAEPLATEITKKVQASESKF